MESQYSKASQANCLPKPNALSIPILMAQCSPISTPLSTAPRSPLLKHILLTAALLVTLAGVLSLSRHQAAVLHTEHASRSQPFAISPEACADAATCAHSMQAMDGAGLHVVTSGATTDEPLHTDAQSHSATGAHPRSITGQSKRANSFIGQHQQQQHALSSGSSNTISAGQGAAHKHYKRQFHGPKEAQQISAPQEPTQTQDQKRMRESAAAAAYPKVALLFLVGGAVGGPLVHNEAVWRAWLKDAEAVGLGGLPPPPPADAMAQELHIDTRQLVGGELHPAIPMLHPAAYKGYMEQLAVQAVLDGKAQAHGPYIGMGSAATTSTYIAPANGSGLATQPSSVLRHNDSVMSGRATARSTTATATLRCFGGGPLHLTAAQATALLSQHATAARGAATAAAYACSLQHFTLMDPRAHSPGFMKNAPHGLLGWASSCTARAGYAVLDTVAPGWPHWVARRKVGQLLHAPVPRMTGLRWPWSAVQEVSASAANTHTKNTVRTDLVSILFGWHNPWNAATSAGSSRGLTGTSKSSSRSASVSASGCARGDQCRGHGHRTAHIMTAAAEDQLVRQAWDAHADAGMQPMQSRISADSSPGADSSQGTDSAASGGSAGKAGTSSQSGASSQSVPEHAHIQNACWSHLQLFRVHVHAPPGTRVSQASPFHGCLLSEPVDTRGAYAQHALVQAELRLLAAALADPFVSRALLLSDSSLPLLPPATLWSQLQWEQRSRVDACRGPGDMDEGRWRPGLSSSHLLRSHWRKSSQWTVLTRAHAQLALDDKHVVELFAQHCATPHAHVIKAQGLYARGAANSSAASKVHTSIESQHSSKDGSVRGNGNNTAAVVDVHAVEPAGRITKALGQGSSSSSNIHRYKLGMQAVPNRSSSRMRPQLQSRQARFAAAPKPRGGASHSSISELLEHARGVGSCVSDEHYLPALLASYGLDGQTDCLGEAHYADWSWGGWHPHAFMPHDMTHALAVAALGGDDCRTAAVAATASAARLLDSGAAHGSIAPLSIAAMHSMHAMDAAGSPAVSESEPAAGAMRNMHRAVRLPSDGMVLQGHDEPDTDPSDSTGGNDVSNDPQPAKGPLSFRAWLEGLGYIPMRSARCHLAMRKVPEVCPWGTLRWALSCDGLRLGRWCAGGRVRA